MTGSPHFWGIVKRIWFQTESRPESAFAKKTRPPHLSKLASGHVRSTRRNLSLWLWRNLSKQASKSTNRSPSGSHPKNYFERGRMSEMSSRKCRFRVQASACLCRQLSQP